MKSSSQLFAIRDFLNRDELGIISWACHRKRGAMLCKAMQKFGRAPCARQCRSHTNLPLFTRSNSSRLGCAHRCSHDRAAIKFSAGSERVKAPILTSAFGTNLRETLLAKAKAVGLRRIFDAVTSHVSESRRPKNLTPMRHRDTPRLVCGERRSSCCQ